MTDPVASSSSSQAVASSASPVGGASLPQAVAAPVRTEKPSPDINNLHAAAAVLNQHAQQLQTSLRFQIDRVTGQLVVSVLDTQSQKVLLQMPGEEALAIAQHLEHVLHPHLTSTTA